MTEESMKDATQETTDKIQAGTKSIANKLKNPGKDMDGEYEKEKIKEEIEKDQIR